MFIPMNPIITITFIIIIIIIIIINVIIIIVISFGGVFLPLLSWSSP